MENLSADAYFKKKQRLLKEPVYVLEAKVEL